MTSRHPPQPLADLARRLLQYEAERAGTAGEVVTALPRVYHSLHERLAPLISSAGFQLLFARSLRLAARDFPFLATVSVRANNECTVVGLPGGTDARKPEEVADALTAALAHFMWLLVSFLGENLGLRKVREAWPEVPFGRLDPSAGAEE